jgi:hypothetical protein
MTIIISTLQDLKVQPRLLAIDRPSPKLVAFMRKHYDLAAVIPQETILRFHIGHQGANS